MEASKGYLGGASCSADRSATCGSQGQASYCPSGCEHRPKPGGAIHQGYRCVERRLSNQMRSYSEFENYCLATGLLSFMLSVCASHRVILRDVYSVRRTASEARARTVIWEGLHTIFGKNYAEIATLFGRDYNTVIRAIKRLVRRRLAGEIFKPAPASKWSLKWTEKS